MLVICKICKTKIDRDTAYKVVINNRNNYYCNKTEYEKMIKEQESRHKVIDLSFQIIGETTNTALMRELKVIADIHTYSKILSYIEQKYEDIKKSMDKLKSNNEYGKIRYYTAIIKNEIGDFTPKKVIDYPTNFEYVKYQFKPTTRKKSFNEYIDEY